MYLQVQCRDTVRLCTLHEDEAAEVNGGRECCILGRGGRDLAREQQLGQVLLAHVDQLESVPLNPVDLFVNFLHCCSVHVHRLEEGLLEHAAHRRVCFVKVIEPLLLIGFEQLPQQDGSRLQLDLCTVYLSFIEGLVERPTQRQVWLGCEYAQVLGRDVVVDVGQPERPPEAQLVEHNAKRPQVVGHARHVLAQLCSIDLTLVIHGPKQHSRKLGRAVPGARGLVAEGLADLAEHVKVDDLPRVAVADGIERLKVGVNAARALGVHVVQGRGEVAHDMADSREVLSRKMLVVNCVQQSAVGQLHHK